MALTGATSRAAFGLIASGDSDHVMRSGPKIPSPAPAVPELLGRPTHSPAASLVSLSAAPLGTVTLVLPDPLDTLKSFLRSVEVTRKHPVLDWNCQLLPDHVHCGLVLLCWSQISYVSFGS